ncbi:tumor necrosis factor receptor superfamily member 16 [Hoplias malabaricus]|uniref:tumor necrosis factor receptor superfamily member 16 n=1 Tax=Hoplias malabaricus TaxID=27720 RepID=UPI0034625AC6
MDTRGWTLLWAAVAVVCGSKLERAVEEVCDSGLYTDSGECCIECPPGEGVVQKCGAKQTVCDQCHDSETYSDIYSATETCQPCTECLGLMRMETPCTDSNDAVCVCDYGFYQSSVTQKCEPCTVCPKGEGVYVRCDPTHDTVCEPCTDDTYSNLESSLDPCLPCTICDENTEIQMRECTTVADAVCFDPSAPTTIPTTSSPWIDGDLLSPGPDEETTTAKPSTPRFIGSGFDENLIPIYCSILAAVLVGLLAYIIFKRWNSCKQNKQAANNRAATANQTPSPEGEKLHSDSGISVDSQSLQEQQQQQQQQQQHHQQQLQQTHTQLHVPEQIVVRVDGGAQPDPTPTQA